MSEIIAVNGGLLIGVRTSIFTIFNQEKYDAKAIPDAWQKFFAQARGTDLANTETFYGASIPSMSLDAPMDYFAGAIVDSSTAVPAGFESVEVPAGDYLVHVHHGPITEIAGSYAAAYTQTLPASGKEMRPAPHLEIYSGSKDPMAADYEMTIAIPVN